MTRRRRTLAIVQPYVPLYRVALFDRMADKLHEHDIELRIVAPPPRGIQAARGDSTDGAPWKQNSFSREVRVAGVTFHYFGSRKIQQEADAVIVPAAASVADSHYALWLTRSAHKPVGLWGHIGNYVSSQHPLDRIIERRMLRTADAVFAYTESGAAVARNYGVDPNRVTCLNNTVDISGLEAALASLKDLHPFPTKTLGPGQNGRMLGYIGGLDADKRVDFLAEVLDELHHIDPATKILIAGRGNDEDMLRVAEDRGQAIRLGYADDATKAYILKVSAALINPGRIGLLAVEAMAAGVPIITTREARHGPEAEYLTQGTSLFVGPSTPRQMAEFVRLFTPKTFVASPPLIDGMAKTYVSGILAMMDGQ